MSGLTTSWVTAVCLAAAAGALLPSGRSAVLARLGATSPRRRRRGVLRLGAVSVAAYVSLGALPTLLGGVLAALVWRQLGRRGAKHLADRTSSALGELLAALVSELRSGAEPRPAMQVAGAGLPGLEPVVAAASHPSGDIAAALAELGRRPGGTTAGELAAAWRVGELTGCGLAAPVARVLHGHRAADSLRRQVAAELAGPVASAYLLSALPLVGIGMGTALGADPAAFLLRDGPGRAVLLAGLGLSCAGVVWTRRIGAAAMRGCAPVPAVTTR